MVGCPNCYRCFVGPTKMRPLISGYHKEGHILSNFIWDNVTLNPEVQSLNPKPYILPVYRQPLAMRVSNGPRALDPDIRFLGDPKP